DVGALHVPDAAAYHGQALVAALQPESSAGVGELLAAVGPAVAVHVVVLDVPADLLRVLQRVVLAVARVGGVVDDDEGRYVVLDDDVARGRTGAPLLGAVDARFRDSGAGLLQRPGLRHARGGV